MATSNGKVSESIDKQLSQGVLAGDASIVRKCIQQGANIHLKDKNGKNALHAAVRINMSEICKILIDGGINVNDTDDLGETPLHIAGKTGNVVIIKMLLAAGANPMQYDNRYDTPLTHAVRHNKTDAAKELLQKIRAERQQSLAASFILVRVCKDLYYKTVDHFMRFLEKEIDLAVEHNNTELVREFVNAGAYVQPVSFSDEPTPLHKSVEKGNLEMTGLLLGAGADVNKYKKYSMYSGGDSLGYGYLDSPLGVAVRKNNLPMVKLLRSKGAHISGAAIQEWTPLMYASMHGYSDIVKELLSAGADMHEIYVDEHQGDFHEYTALHFAASENKISCAKSLIDSRANLNASANGKKQYNAHETPLKMAVRKGHVNMAALLVNAGTTLDLGEQTNKNSEKVYYSETELMLAATAGNDEIAKLLLDARAKVNTVYAWGHFTPLMMAVESDSLSVVELLIKAGADVNALGYLGSRENIASPLTLAEKKGNPQIIQALKKAGAKTAKDLIQEEEEASIDYSDRKRGPDNQGDHSRAFKRQTRG